MKNRWKANVSIFLVLLLVLTVAGVLAQVELPENCYTTHFDFEEFGVNECANGGAVIVHLIDNYPPMVQTSKRLVTLSRLTEKYGRPIKISANPTVYVWNKDIPFRRITAMELNGQPGLDVIVLREFDVLLLHPTPTLVRGGDGF